MVRRLWDSWEDDAEIRDVATGRFIDRDKLHYIDFEGRFFSVKGPSIVPRPPQGQPLVAALAHSPVPCEFAARSADVVFVTPADEADVAAWVGDVRAAEDAVGRTRPAADGVRRPRRVPRRRRRARRRDARRRLDELDGRPQRSDAAIFTGTPGGAGRPAAGVAGATASTGSACAPACCRHDLDAIVDGLVPELQRRGAFRTAYDETDAAAPGFGLDACRAEPLRRGVSRQR